MNTWKVILATVLIFGTGVVTGGLLARQSQRQFWRQLSQPKIQQAAKPGTLPAGSTRLEFLRKAERELDLSLEQRRQVDRVITAGQERMRKLMEPITPRMREEIVRTREEFRAILTPEQREKMDMFQKQQRIRDLKRRQEESRKRE